MTTRNHTKKMKEWNEFILLMNHTNGHLPLSYDSEWNNYRRLLFNIGWDPISPNDYYQEKESYLSLTELDKNKSINEIYNRIRNSELCI